MPKPVVRSGLPPQSSTPYLDALRAYASRDPGRFHVPGHKGGPGADPGLRQAIGGHAPELDPELYIAHCLTPDALARALDETPRAAGAIVVSPTYFGAVADVAGLVEVAHSRDVPLVVDE